MLMAMWRGLGHRHAADRVFQRALDVTVLVRVLPNLSFVLVCVHDDAQTLSWHRVNAIGSEAWRFSEKLDPGALHTRVVLGRFGER